ncbi:uncharacterized protein MYCGRDRAFT_75146 [Zymoseptoria tritici IPO323]|uniref:Carboxylic ester hydrolase n=1 Tax=Zymoseptoria tritici (strain CBS 115943 / IPO323) TaxID=336722 RepID=F9XH29_ZYMTI|nr:uncharacterized protein MYCGRDRAFT_75146 [Zymoseptoria tritici IPO323]EGP85142.1 hypothetical protein MYCGRDRAFT_75146 [Zymoseptoria tritici IPO323]
MRAFSISFALAAPLLALAAPAKRAGSDPTVTLSSGVIVGTATSVLNQPSATGLVNAYLGIPYAQSPPLRFAPPTAAQAWSEPLIAQKFPPSCLQQFFPGEAGVKTKAYLNNPGGPPPAESEDCLYTNVYVPEGTKAGDNKAVMFWIYGGNNQFGTGSLAFYNGSSLAVNHDVIIVTFNYRMNIFGFSNSPEIPKNSQNSGYLDQRFALQWVQDNIRAFGGDPAKVTIFGESAGGYGVKQLLAQPPSPLPFRAAILESQAQGALGNGAVNYPIVLAHFNCADITCLRAVPAQDILDFITDNALGFFAVEDNTNVNSNSLPSISSGQFAPVPILIGTNKDEFTLFLDILGLNGATSPSQVPGLPANLSLIANPLTDLYNSLVPPITTPILSRIATDAVFTCPASSLSSAIVSAGRQPVWRYRFDADFPNVRFYPNAGAYHSSEIPEVFGTYFENAQTTTAQRELSKYMQSAWAGFAKNPTQGPGWPKLGSAGGKELQLLGSKANENGGTTVSLTEADVACPLIFPVDVAAGFAY